MRRADRIMAQQEAIRRSGMTNMFDRNTVQRIAHECDFHELVVFIEESDGGEYTDMAEKAVAYFDDGDDLPDGITVPEEEVELTETLTRRM